MSAFVGIIDLSGAPLQRTYLDDMATYLKRIGPDSQNVWVDGQAGMVQALLNTTSESIKNQQPFVLGNHVIIGDARIDDKKNFLNALRAKGVTGLDKQQDIEIILHAWLIWKEKLTDFLIGDFSLAIWDGVEKKIFCLRDQMGIKPFFYAWVGKLFVFSNVLNCLRAHPDISEELNDQAVMDFLVFGHNLEFTSTIFGNIHQLAPAHSMVVSSSKPQIRRYWSLPVEDVIRYRRAEDYVEHFKELLNVAVRDRLPDGNVGVAMSGGLDSTSIAACAHELLSTESILSLYTLDIKSLWPEDEEIEHAEKVANYLKVELYSRSIDSNDLFQYEKNADWLLPEPSIDVFRPPQMALFREIAGQNRVGLTGHGSDSILMASPAYFNSLLRNKQWWRFLIEAGHYIRLFHRRPPLYIRASLKKRLERSPWQPTFPKWLPTEMLEQTGFADRYAKKMDKMFTHGAGLHPSRPEAYLDLSSSIWQSTLSRFDPQTTGLAIDFRHPYFDIRLIRFTLSLPVMPWFQQKEFLRKVMTGRLPDSVRSRRKSMPRISPVYRGMNELQPADWKGHLETLEKVAKYINLESFSDLIRYTGSLKSDETDQVSLPIAFANWLKENSL